MPAMRRTFLAAAAAVVVIAFTQQAHAVCCDDTAMYVKQGYRANQMWPWPYVCPDRDRRSRAVLHHGQQRLAP